MGAASTRGTTDPRREIKHCPTCGQRFSREAAFCPFDGSRLEGALFDPTGDPLLGAVVDGRYVVHGVLGEGGMGRVYEVRHAALERAFAMKVLRPELAREEDLAERFIREAKATASVKHPNVVQITDFGRMPDGIPFFVMELLVGQTLGEIIKAGGPVPVPRAVRIIRKVAGALGAAHEAGVVHRDLKPDNVFLVDGNHSGADVRVVDFGAAKIVGSSRMTRAGVVFGTPHYMSPEQASGQSVDHRTDVYALGVIMYEMFTGKVPFEADTYMGVLTQHMFVQPEPPSRVSEAARDLGALEGITLRCLAKKPEERYASMAELVTAVDDGCRHTPAEPGEGASRIEFDATVPAIAVDPVTTWPELQAAETTPARRRRAPGGPPLLLLWAAVGLTAALVVAVAARLFLHREEGAGASATAPVIVAAPGSESPSEGARLPPSPPLSAPLPTSASAGGAAPLAPEPVTSAPARLPPPPAGHPTVHHQGSASMPGIRREGDDVGDPFAPRH